MDNNGAKAEIYLAGGCFWGVDEYFSRINGVTNTLTGYANGTLENPTYDDALSGQYGFAETVWVEYNPQIISLDELLNHFFKVVNPTTLNRQAFDVGIQYRSGIYYTNPNDKEIIDNKIQEKQKGLDKPIVTEVKELENFYKAEEYHQKYLKKNPQGYCHIKFN